jgi:hypothetical protein
MEVINLDMVDLSGGGDDSNTITLNKGDSIRMDSSPGMSMAGAELLMNHNTKKTSDQKEKEKDPSIELDDLTSLENDLNSLTIGGADKLNISGSNEPIKLNIGSVDDAPKSSESSSGPTITKLGEPEKTWDGFQQFNNIPMNPDKEVSSQPKKSRETVLKEKFNYLRKLEALEKKGVRLSKQYTMESSLEEMIGEYETIKSEKERSNSVKFQGRMLMAAVTGLEFLNNRFDPFDFKLDGWSEQVNENMDDYDEIFGELHEKYSSKAKMAPELKLLFQLSGSAIMLHMTNTMFKSSVPGMDDILRQNPELMQQFTQAAVNQMGEQKPGFGNFMNDMMNQQNSRSQPPAPPPSMSQGPPPPSMKTRNPGRMDNFSRPDIGFGRGGPEEGISLSNSFENPDKPNRSARKPRPEMKGPSSDIDDLLSGLKTKIPSGAGPSVSQSTKKVNTLTPNSKPKKSSRRPISEKNTVSLDI